jgi:predicted dehydrogenase
VGLIQQCLGAAAWVQGRAGAFFFAEHAAAGADDFGALSLGTRGGELATLCGARIGAATHNLGGPLRAQLVGARASAVVDGKRPALEVFLRQHLAQAQYLPPAEDPMQWASGSPVLGASLAGDPTGLYAGLEDLVESLDQNRQPRYTVAHGRDLMEILIAGYRSAAAGGRPMALPLERRQ